MAEPFDPARLAQLVRAHVEVAPGSLRFTPVSTGRHNRSFWVDSDQGRFVLRIAPADDVGLLFYERRMMRQEPDLHALIRACTTMSYSLSRRKGA